MLKVKRDIQSSVQATSVSRTVRYNSSVPTCTGLSSQTVMQHNAQIIRITFIPLLVLILEEIDKIDRPKVKGNHYKTILETKLDTKLHVLQLLSVFRLS